MNEQTLYIDIDPKMAKGLELGEMVEIVVRGTIKELRSREEYDYPISGCGCSATKKAGVTDKKEKTYSSVSLKVSKVSVGEKNEFAKMTNDDEDE